MSDTAMEAAGLGKRFGRRKGWALRDHWALLGEHIPVNSRFFTSVSAETDNRLGWSARGRWNNDHATLQLTRIDNRADALRYGELFNWATRFNIIGGDYSWRGWTAVAENGWGTTAIQGRNRFSFPIRAGYVMLSRRIGDWRASARAEEFEAGADEGHAFTGALMWEPKGKIRAGVEGITAKGQKRVAVELRYRF